jgi:acid stress-induced BolA-like protein IbaG/YrbA
MKTLIILLLLAATGLTGQKTDTIFTNVGKVTGKKVTIVNTEVRDDGSEVATKVVYDKTRAEAEIKKMQQDTANLTKYLENLKLTEEQIKNERQLVKQKRRVIEELLDKLQKLLKDL